MFPQFSPYALPKLIADRDVDWSAAGLDLRFLRAAARHHAEGDQGAARRRPRTKVVDLSADFRLADPAAYARWYGHEHHAPELQKEAVYGLVEIYRRDDQEGAARRQSRLLHDLRAACRSSRC